MKRKPTGHEVLLNMWTKYGRGTSGESRSGDQRAGSMPMEGAGPATTASFVMTVP